MATVFLNGRFVSQDEARVSAFDAGVQHGVGLFETMLGGTGGDSADGDGARAWVFRLEEHLERLISSARELGLSEGLRAPGLAEAVLSTVEKSGLARARIRLTVTGGDLNLLGRAGAGAEWTTRGGAVPPAPGRVQPTIMIVAQPATEYPQEMFERGVSGVVADFKVNPLDPLAGHKTVNYWGRLRELQQAAAKQAGEALVFQVTNHLAGGCVSNAFVVKGGEVSTPVARGEETQAAAEHEKERQESGPAAAKSGVVLPSPVLPGITRGWVLEWAAAPRIGVHRRILTIHDLLDADEVFLTNASWGVMPVVRLEKERIGGGRVGPVSARVLAAWRDAVAGASRI